MPDLSFSVEGAAPIPFAAAPTLAFKLRITNADPAEHIQNILLACQIQIESTRRRYTPEEKGHLLDLFGEPARWTQTLRAMLWTHASAMVPPFDGEIVADLLVPCTFDFNVAATKYFSGLEQGEVPLNLLFSGTVFFAGEEGALSATRISLDEGGPLPPAGERLERDDGPLLSEARLALPRAGSLRSPARVQAAPRDPDV